MRQWNINPKFLCTQHLLDEHYDLHKAIGAIKRHKNIQTYIDQGLLMPTDIPRRHEELVQEIVKRGIEHLTPLPNVRGLPTGGYIDGEATLLELTGCCPNCKVLIEMDESVRGHEDIREYIAKSLRLPPENFNNRWKRKNVTKKSTS